MKATPFGKAIIDPIDKICPTITCDAQSKLSFGLDTKFDDLD
ncbi:hypothetical protein [Chamaesiphon sp. VAR_48_metabat_135_sub]|nr:hypothetical protein [Chamaesiphon sp. VAR_48_metabat_135_sub]